jgi:CRISPR-associated protein Csd2
MPPHSIYMLEGSVLNNQHKKAYEALDEKIEAKKLPKDEKKAREITAWMCRNYYDIRSFGAVMTTDINCGRVRGPIQIGFAQSIDPILPIEVSITRSSVTNEKDTDKERTMGRKYIVPYGLYRAHGYISANLASRTGFSDGDLGLFFDAMKSMFEHDRSAARGEMTARRLIVFKHDTALGNAPAHKLFESVVVEPIGGARAPSSYADYKDRISIGAVPAGVLFSEMI